MHLRMISLNWLQFNPSLSFYVFFSCNPEDFRSIFGQEANDLLRILADPELYKSAQAITDII
jgi:hypothetical protein